MKISGLIRRRSEKLHVTEFNAGVGSTEPILKSLAAAKENYLPLKHQQQSGAGVMQFLRNSQRGADISQLVKSASGKPSLPKTRLVSPVKSIMLPATRITQASSVFTGLANKLRKPVAEKDKNITATKVRVYRRVLPSRAYFAEYPFNQGRCKACQCHSTGRYDLDKGKS